MYSLGDVECLLPDSAGREALIGGTIISAVFVIGHQLLTGHIASASFIDNKLCLMLYVGIFAIPIAPSNPWQTVMALQPHRPIGSRRKDRRHGRRSPEVGHRSINRTSSLESLLHRFHLYHESGLRLRRPSHGLHHAFGNEEIPTRPESSVYTARLRHIVLCCIGGRHIRLSGLGGCESRIVKFIATVRESSVWDCVAEFPYR